MHNKHVLYCVLFFPLQKTASCTLTQIDFALVWSQDCKNNFRKNNFLKPLFVVQQLQRTVTKKKDRKTKMEDIIFLLFFIFFTLFIFACMAIPAIAAFKILKLYLIRRHPAPSRTSMERVVVPPSPPEVARNQKACCWRDVRPNTRRPAVTSHQYDRLNHHHLIPAASYTPPTLPPVPPR